MSKITFQDILAHCDAQTDGGITKNCVEGKGSEPLALLSSGATAMLELLIERGVITTEVAVATWDQDSAIAAMEAARQAENTVDVEKYTISLDQMLRDLYAKFPGMRVMELSMSQDLILMVMGGLYVLVIDHMQDSGYINRHAVAEAMAQAARLTKEIAEKTGKPVSDRAKGVLNKHYPM